MDSDSVPEKRPPDEGAAAAGGSVVLKYTHALIHISLNQKDWLVGWFALLLLSASFLGCAEKAPTEVVVLLLGAADPGLITPEYFFVHLVFFLFLE